MEPTPDTSTYIVVGGLRLDAGLVRVARIGALVGLWVIGVSAATFAVRAYVFHGYAPLGVDAHAYWLAGRSAIPYDAPPESLDAFLYSPAFKQAVTPFALLPFPIFFALWALIEGTAFAWLLRPLGWRWGLPCWLLCVPEMLLGNIVGLLAVCVVLGVRRPELWAFPLLTKVTGGVLGAIWFVVRAEWWYLTRYVFAVIVVCGSSYLLAPEQWTDWVRFLRDSGGSGHGLLVRCVIAAVVVVVGARSGRPWLLAPAVLLATPVIGGNSVIAILTAIPRLVRLSAHDRSGDGLLEPTLRDR